MLCLILRIYIISQIYKFYRVTATRNQAWWKLSRVHPHHFEREGIGGVKEGEKRKEGNREREKRRGVNTEILKRRKYNSSVLFAKYFLYFRSNRVPNRGHAIYMCSLPYIDEDFSVSFLAALPLSLPPD